MVSKIQLRYTFKSLLASLGWRRGSRFSCPICNRQFSSLDPFTGAYSIRGELIDHYTPNSMCPVCNSDIRHRFITTYLSLNLFGKRVTPTSSVLHFAPEPGIYRALRRYFRGRYTAADLNAERYTFAADAQRVDITNIPFEDSSFDLVLCVHVLEHIEDDLRACTELYRVLKPNGIALIALPTYGSVTHEIPGLDEQGRVTQFGDPTHVRLNGLDFAQKMERAGFRVQIVTLDEVPGNYYDRSIASPHIESDRYLFVGEK